MNGICKTILFLMSAVIFIFYHGSSMAASTNRYYTESDIVIPPVYTHAKPFSEGFAAVCEHSGSHDKAWHYITPEGKPAFTEKSFFGRVKNITFREAESFSEGLGMVWTERGVGYIDTQGKLAIPPQFAYGSNSFKNGKALVLSGPGEPWAYINAEGKRIVTFDEFSFLDSPGFIDGRARISYYDSNAGMSFYGFMDEKGEAVIPPRYREAQPFSEGLAAVQMNDGEEKRWVYIDRDGNIAIPRRFRQALSFENGLAMVRTGDHLEHEYINTRGETVMVEPKEGVIHRYGDTFERMLCIGDRQCGIQDMDGNWIIAPVFPEIMPFSEGLAIFEVTYATESWSLRSHGAERRVVGAGVINRKGEIIVPLGKHRRIDSYKHGLARVDGIYGESLYIDTNGNLVENALIPIGEPSEGLQLVRNQDDKYGYVRAR